MAKRRRRFSISRRNIRTGMSRAKSALSRLEKHREAAREMMHQVVSATEVGVSSFGFGWIKGNYGEVDVMGVPIDIGFAAVGHLLGFTGILGKDLSRHMHNFSNGALASWANDKGRQIGAEMSQDSASGHYIGGVPRRRGALGPAQAAPWRQHHGQYQGMPQAAPVMVD